MTVDTKDLPEISPEHLDLSARVMVISLLDTGAEEMTINQTKFHDRKGEIMGDFEIIVRKKV